MKIKKKIPRSHREMLYELYADFKDANKQLEKEAKHERIGVFAGAVGLLITIFWGIEPKETTAFVGDLGVTLSFTAMIFGAWAYFAPPSQSKTRTEYYIIEGARKKLEEYGYDPTIEFGEVRFKGEQTYLKISDDSSYEDAETKPEPNKIAEIEKSTSRQNYKAPNLIFKTGVDAFQYIKETSAFPDKLQAGETYVGLVLVPKTEKARAHIAALVNENLEPVVDEVIASFDRDLSLTIEKHDLVLWECVFSDVGMPLGVILAKSTLEYDVENSDFVWVS